MTETACKPEDLMHEDQVYERYKTLLADRELREARRNKLIEWFDLRKGPHYTAAGVMAYLERKRVQSCQDDDPALDADKNNASGKSGRSGSGRRKAQTSTSTTGMTPRLEELAAKQLENGT